MSGLNLAGRRAAPRRLAIEEWDAASDRHAQLAPRCRSCEEILKASDHRSGAKEEAIATSSLASAQEGFLSRCTATVFSPRPQPGVSSAQWTCCSQSMATLRSATG